MISFWQVTFGLNFILLALSIILEGLRKGIKKLEAQILIKLKSYNIKIALSMKKGGYGLIQEQISAGDSICSSQSSAEEQSSFALPKQQISKTKKVQDRIKRKRGRRFNQNGWSLRENLLYMQFLKNNIGLFEYTKSQRQSIKINVKISRAVRTRTSNQCRSHHQKMIQSHQNIPNIIRFIEKMKQDAQEKSPLNKNRTLSTKNDSGPESIQHVSLVSLTQEQGNMENMQNMEYRDYEYMENLFENGNINFLFVPVLPKIVWYDDSQIQFY